jgi:hypothetical protein
MNDRLSLRFIIIAARIFMPLRARKFPRRPRSAVDRSQIVTDSLIAMNKMNV